LSGFFRRDTDSDWEELGRTAPYWGVHTHPDYAGKQSLDPDKSAEFFATGEEFVAWVRGVLEEKLGAPREIGSALDFGCGVGRLLVPMAKRAGRAVGVDISESMRALCMKHLADAGLTNASTIADLAQVQGPFDWVNTYIVLQHIEPSRGYGIIERLSALTARDGALTLHITTARDDHLKPPSWSDNPLAALAYALHKQQAKRGLIMMYDYDLARVLDQLTRDGFGAMWLQPLDHGGHRGMLIHARKNG